ncbi:MAG: ankyrin repeat domain-containing protein [Candidatus Symbiodolus clandestinus]
MVAVFTHNFRKKTTSVTSRVINDKTISPEEYPTIIEQFKAFIGTQPEKQRPQLKALEQAWKRLPDNATTPSARKWLAPLMQALMDGKFNKTQYKNVLNCLVEETEVCREGVITNLNKLLEIIYVPNFSQNEFILSAKANCIEQLSIELIHREFEYSGNETHLVSRIMNYLSEYFGINTIEHELSPLESIPAEYIIQLAEEVKEYLSLTLTVDYFCDRLTCILLEDLEDYIGKPIPIEKYSNIGERIQSVIMTITGQTKEEESSINFNDFIETLKDGITYQLKNREQLVTQLKPLVMENLQRRGFIEQCTEDKSTAITDYAKDNYLSLRVSVKAGNKELIETWLNSDEKDNILQTIQKKFYHHEDTLLIIAAKRGRSSIVATLLNYAEKAQISKEVSQQTNGYGDTPLLAAANYGYQTIAETLLEFAAQAGITKDILQKSNMHGTTPLMSAA